MTDEERKALGLNPDRINPWGHGVPCLHGYLCQSCRDKSDLEKLRAALGEKAND